MRSTLSSFAYTAAVAAAVSLLPGARRPSALGTSSSTAMVRVLTSTDRATRATVPVNASPGYAAKVKAMAPPVLMSAV